MKSKAVVPMLFLLPHALFFSVFVLYPVFQVVFMSLHEWGVAEGQLDFLGFKNYFTLFNTEAVRSQQFWQSLGVTVQFVIYTVPLFIVASLLLALALHSRALVGKALHLTAVFLPTALAATIIATLWRMVFNDSGILNLLIVEGGGERIPWLSDLPWAWITLVVATLWWTIGWNVIILLGGLQKIPETLYEAAKIDGAGPWLTFRTVTLPGLQDLLLYVGLTQGIASFGLFAQAQLMTKGYPGRDTVPVAMHIFGTAFGSSDPLLGFSAAMSVVTGVVIMSASLAQYFVFERRSEGDSK